MDFSSISAAVEKCTGLKAYIGSSDELVVRKIPFGIPQLDAIIGGGAPCGRIMELVGEWSTGKTYICQKLIQSAQQMDLDVVYMNVENKYDPEWFVRTGINTDNITVVQGNIGESVFDALISFIGSNVGLVVVDSIAALIPLAEEEDAMGQQTIGLQARMLSKGFRKILYPLSTSKTALVFINQLRSGIGPYATDTYPGGRSQYFYSSLTIHVRRGEWDTENRNGVEVRRGFRIECRTVKNTLAPPWRTCSVPFLFTGEIDIVATLCEMAMDMQLIEKAGSWYTLPIDMEDGEKKRVQGWDNVLSFYRSDGKYIRELSQLLAGEE